MKRVFYKKEEKSKDRPQKPRTRKGGNGAIKPDLSFLKGDNFKITIGLLIIVIAIYMLIAMVSFLFYGGVDNHVAGKGFYDILSINVDAENLCGPLGAKISAYLINRCVGLGAFAICYILIATGVRVLTPRFTGYAKHVVVSLAIMIWVSLFLGYISFKYTELTGADTGHLYLGGAHGYYISMWLSRAIGNGGTILLLLVTLALILLFGFRRVFDWCTNSLFATWRGCCKRSAALAEARKQRAAERAEREAREAEERAAKEAEEQAKREAEERAAREAEEQAKREAEEQAKREAEERDAREAEEQAKREAEERDARGAQEQDDDQAKENNGNENKNEEKDNIEFEVNKIQEIETITENLPDYDPTLDLSYYKYPTLDLLADVKSETSIVTDEELEANKQRIVETLQNYKIDIVKIQATIGPTVTLYEIVPAPGVKIARIKNLEDDIALSLSALGIRIIAPIPGQGTVGIEVPNRNPQIVPMKDLIASKKFQESKYALPVVIGRTISNEPFTFDLAKMPHMLVAGATGQGKSVGLNAIITSLLYKKHPAQLKFVMIDPKKVELSIYSIIEKHFLAKLPDAEKPIITENDKVVSTLNSLCIEMDNRYSLLEKANCRTVKEYNEKFSKRQLNPNNGHRYLPYIVVIVDEFADLIMTAGKEVEKPICRIAQLARAVGIHMIIATQRPSTNIITGTIKANFPARIAFKVAQMVDSRTILDAPGANQLIGRGDMLISVGNEVTRIQCAFVDTPEVEKITQHIANQQGYPTAYELPEYVADNKDNGMEVTMNGGGGKRDEMFEECARFVVGCQQGSTSALQRRFGIGFNRAGRIMDQLENEGIVGPASGSKPRSVLMDEYSLEKLLNEL